MKAEDKAKELFYNFLNIESEEPIFVISTNQAKQCALICVDEILRELKELHHKTPLFYWQKVKTEIEKL